MKVIGDFMTRLVVSVAPQVSAADAVALMEEHRIRHLPIEEAGRLVGLLSHRDLARRPPHLRALVPVSKLMRRDPFTTGPELSLRSALTIMARRRIGSIVVVGKAGEPLGIFTTIDALRALASLV